MSDPSYPVGIRNGLITGEHRRRMKNAVWEFMWLVDHVTEERQTADGEIHGVVLGGAMINADRLSRELGVSLDTIRTNIDRLDLAGYIIAQRVAYGYRFLVRKSKKWPGRGSSVPDASTSSQSHGPPIEGSEGERVGELESWRVGKNTESPDLQDSNSPTPIDIAVKRDIAKSNASTFQGEDAPTRETVDGADIMYFCQRWAAAAAAVLKNEAPAAKELLHCCYVRSVVDDTLSVFLPLDRGRWPAVERLMPKLQAALRMDSQRPLGLVMVDPNNGARDGPEVSADAAEAAGP